MNKDKDEKIKNETSNQLWNQIKEACNTAADKVLKKKTKKEKNQNNRIKELSNKQKAIQNQIKSTKNENQIKTLRQMRNNIMREIHYLIRIEKENIELKKIESIENSKDDSGRMFRTIRLSNHTKKKEHVFIEENETALNNEKSTEKITEYFTKLFSEEEIKTDLDEIKPIKMKVPFSSEEIRRAIKKLKNNKTPGPDNIPAELFKNCPEELISKIVDLFNNIAQTGEIPQDLDLGYLIPLHKAGQKKGKTENLRPIILLNIIRKLLALVIIIRIGNKIDNEIPITQAAYRKGRGTTENVFTFKVLAEKAIIEQNAEINIRLMDMSKAFDSVNRNELLKDLKLILEEDELHIVKLLLTNVKLQVKNKDLIGEKFNTTRGIPQGDSLSPMLFTLYLAKSMEKHNKEKSDENITKEHNYSKEANTTIRIPSHLKDHTYYKKQEQGINIKQEFADDISRLNRYEEIVEELIKEDTEQLERRNFIINPDKTEKFKISINSDEKWKKCKYLGSLLGTDEDISRRKQLAMVSYNKYKNILESKKLSLKVRCRLFNVYVSSIFFIQQRALVSNEEVEQ